MAAALFPNFKWLVESGRYDHIRIYHRDTGEVLVEYHPWNPRQMWQAQTVIRETDKLTDEEKSWAHYWCGYLSAGLTPGLDTESEEVDNAPQ